MAIRAKVTCVTREAKAIGELVNGKWVTGEVVQGKCSRTFTFAAVYSAEPEHENKAFWDATPIFELKMTIQNPASDFEVGREYYIDFLRAPRFPDQADAE